MDATPTYRGFRRQILYTLHRLVSSNTPLRPEGVEDIDVYDAAQRRVAVYQIKDHTEELALSTLKPGKQDSFLRRAVQLIEQNHELEVHLISFGPIGSELRKAAARPGPDRDEITSKLVALEFTDLEIGRLFQRFRIEKVDEDVLVQDIREYLSGTMAVGDPDHAFDLLMYWLYTCAEAKQLIDRRMLNAKLTSVGIYLNNASHFHTVWQSTLEPLIDTPIDTPTGAMLRDEFFRGLSVEFEHVIAGADVVRKRKIEQIREGFRQGNVVVVHGASGQGKSTLAYRYLLEQVPSSLRLRVNRVIDQKHALEIAAALKGHVSRIGLPFAVLIDVVPGDAGWTELVKKLSRVPNAHVLVCIREEDWQKDPLSPHEVQFTDLGLTLEEDEARTIFYELHNSMSIRTFINFDDAWHQFGGQGPLLEFVYLVTQGGLIKERLAKQVRSLQEQARSSGDPRELTLLRLISVAGAYEARLNTRELVESIGLPVPQLSLRRLENEYLVRTSDDGSLVTGLHPIRSQILVDLLIDPGIDPWIESARQSLALMFGKDVESFLMMAFSRRPQDSQQLIEALRSFYPTTWTSVAGVTRALLWTGLRDYSNLNRQTIEAALIDSGPGWQVVLDTDLADAKPGLADSMMELFERIGPERAQQIRGLRQSQTDKRQALSPARNWLATLPLIPNPTAGDEEWSALGLVTFWAGHLNVSPTFLEDSVLNTLANALHELTPETIGDIIAGLHKIGVEGIAEWLLHDRPNVVARLIREGFVASVEDDGQTVRGHFIVVPPVSFLGKKDDATRKDWLNEEAVRRATILRMLFPDRERFSTQGYGHQSWTFGVEQTTKSIPEENLPVRWLPNVNGTFRGIVEYWKRPDDWYDFAHEVLELRRAAISVLEDLSRALPAYLSTRAPIDLMNHFIDRYEWFSHWRRMRDTPMLPKCAVDEWGFRDEISLSHNNPVLKDRHDSSLQGSTQLLNALKEYAQGLENFLLMAPDVIKFNSGIGKEKRPSGPSHRSLDSEEGNDSQMAAKAKLSLHNLLRSAKVLGVMQLECRNLLGLQFDEQIVSSFEHREEELFEVVWPLWRAYAEHPYLVVRDPARTCKKHVDRQLQDVTSDVESELISLFAKSR